MAKSTIRLQGEDWGAAGRVADGFGKGVRIQSERDVSEMAVEREEG